jgi:hypothetical protein
MKAADIGAGEERSRPRNTCCFRDVRAGHQRQCYGTTTDRQSFGIGGIWEQERATFRRVDSHVRDNHNRRERTVGRNPQSDASHSRVGRLRDDWARRQILVISRGSTSLKIQLSTSAICDGLLSGLSPLVQKCLWWRWLRLTTIVPAKKQLLNLYRDLIQPSLGPVCPLLVMPRVYLKVPYSVLSRPKLSGQLMSHRESLLVLCLGIIGRAVNEPQNGLGCPVKWVASFRHRLDVRFWRKRNDRVCCN